MNDMKLDDIEILKDIFAIDKDRYKKTGDYSTTEIIDPPRVVQLKRRYVDAIEEKPSQKIDSLMGTAMHLVFEKNLDKYNRKYEEGKYELETEFNQSFDIGERTVSLSGRFDICTHGVHITDVKTAKVWKKVFDPELTDWTIQQNVYAYLATSTEGRKPIKSISALVIYKDWKENEMLRAGKHGVYPKEPIEYVPLQLWSPEGQYQYIIDRLGLHITSEELADDDLPECTTEEMWARFPDMTEKQYALFKKPEAKKATKILHEAKGLADAIRIASGIKGVTAQSVIEVRHPVRKRCERYCPGNTFCSQYQTYMKNKESNNMNEHISMKGYI